VCVFERERGERVMPRGVSGIPSILVTVNSHSEASTHIYNSVTKLGNISQFEGLFGPRLDL